MDTTSNWIFFLLISFDSSSFLNIGYYGALTFPLYSIVGEQCVDRFLGAFNALDALVENGDGERIQEILHLCHSVDTDSHADVAALFEIYYDYISMYINVFQWVFDGFECEVRIKFGLLFSALMVFVISVVT